MRDRLVLAFTGIAFALVVLYAVPRAYFLANLVEDNAQRQLDRTAELVVSRVDAALDDGLLSQELLGSLTGTGEHILVQLPETNVADPSFGEVDIDDLTATRPLENEGSITVTLSNEWVSDQVTSAIMPLVLIGLALIGVAALTGWLLARRLSRPFVRLAEAASQLGTGHRIQDVPTDGIPEAAAIGRALRDGSTRMELLLQHEREVALNASHELRTPIAGLRLSLEDLALWPDVGDDARTEVHRLLGEVDRLAGAVTTLLDSSTGLTMSGTSGEAIAAGLTASLRGRGIETPLDPPPSPTLHVPGATVDLAVAFDALLDLALPHATSPVRVGVEDRSSHVALVVATRDHRSLEGTDEVRRARELSAALDGRVVVADSSISLLLPLAVET
ncbi:MAG TPA: HAMP domain-containing sensor histidine kinase [Nocardioidaceae bacterium]|nr:HAMP domain-containing sensor histidine kinase [Nocardioidaceae bacterium]